MERNYPRFPRIQLQSLVLVALSAMVGVAGAEAQSFIGSFNTVTTLSTTVPTNGDVNPYGVAWVPVSKGKLVHGRFLISNFNNGANLQGTGTTIVQIAPNGTFSLFAEINPKKIACPGGVGLTTALTALSSGYVIVGSLPAAGGKSANAKAGCLIVLNSSGDVVETISGHHINGPWDMTAADFGPVAVLFVTNVLNGTVAAGGKLVEGGTVARLLLFFPEGGKPELLDSSVIGSGFEERTDPNALVIGPTGVAFNFSSDTVYVADSLKNRVTAIPDALLRGSSAGTGSVVSKGGNLNDPLGLTLAPDGHLLEANGNDGKIVEINPKTGSQVAWKLVDSTGGPPPGAGALFGLVANSAGVYFVDDASNTFNLLH